MAKFYIESIKAYGDQVELSEISFIPGLNIIKGYSDTGKTCILKCIDYIFGSSEIPFDKNTGYSTVSMSLKTINGVIILTRMVGKNQVTVSSSDNDIESGVYDLKYRKNQKKPVLNSVWLKLIGIDGEPTIPKNNNFERRHLTWRTILHLLLLREDDIARPTSIVVPEQYTEKTAFFSTLLYLISERDFSDNDIQEKKEIILARRKAVEEYVNKKLFDVADRRKKISEQLNSMQGIDINAEVSRIIDDIKNTESAITEAMNNSKNLLAQVLLTEEKASECKMLLDRYQGLKSQYVSDIHRLTLIVEGETDYQNLPHSRKCPFCSGTIPIKKRPSYIESARAELSKIVSQLNSLDSTITDVQTEFSEIKNELQLLQTKRENIETLIKEALRPQADKLQVTLEKYQAYNRLSYEINLVDSFQESWLSDLRQLPPENSYEPKYSPKDYFDKIFLATMDIYAHEILRECQFENFSSTRFNLSDFDIEINGRKKATNHGQGYRAFLNTVVALMFRKYLHNNAKFDPGLLIIDTPLLGLDQGVNDEAPESMRTALFQYFLNHQDEGQMIVIENLDNLPVLPYENYGTNVITFTKGHSTGMYGFLKTCYSPNK